MDERVRVECWIMIPRRGQSQMSWKTQQVVCVYKLLNSGRGESKILAFVGVRPHFLWHWRKRKSRFAVFGHGSCKKR